MVSHVEMHAIASEGVERRVEERRVEPGRSGDREVSLEQGAPPDRDRDGRRRGLGRDEIEVPQPEVNPIASVDVRQRGRGDGDHVRPDPRSRRQPDGVHGLSAHVDHEALTAAAPHLTDAMWTGRQLAGGLVYEMHVGTFTPEGTLDAAAGRLSHLVDLGVSHIELLPVNGFNGVWNWGYDGVLWYTVHEAYGGPAAYVRFVQAAHAAGLAVIQDVVYNHLGPSGNYLPEFGFAYLVELKDRNEAPVRYGYTKIEAVAD